MFTLGDRHLYDSFYILDEEVEMPLSTAKIKTFKLCITNIKNTMFELDDIRTNMELRVREYSYKKTFLSPHYQVKYF